MNRTTVLALGLLATLQLATAQEEPNYQLEEKFHKIFKEFNQTPVSDEVWGQAYQNSPTQNYEVMNQDTLWDISKVLFADPFFWPKIWSFNTDILNPHEIKPGWIVRFIPGTLKAPPTMTVTEYEGVTLPAGKATKPIADLPPSIPEYKPEIPDFRPPVFKKPDLTALTTIPPLPLPAEIFPEKPESKGEVVEVEEGGRLASDNRELFIKLDPDMKEGRYSVIRYGDKNRRGVIVQYRGEVEIKGLINDSENIYRAMMTKAVDSVEVGDFVIPGPMPMVDISEVPVVGSGPLLMKVIGGVRSPTDLLYAPYSIIFIDGGTEHGLSEGEALHIYQYPKVRQKDTKVLKSYRQIGLVRIIRVQKNVSTAYILNSSIEIRDGDLVGILEGRPVTGQSGSSGEDDLTLD